MILAVTGGHHYADTQKVCGTLDVLHGSRRIERLIHGAASGADILAGLWATDHQIPVTKYPADWRKYGKAAGPKRNALMLDIGKPDLLVAFPGGPGTTGCIKLARERGIEVLEVQL